jgi:hypothetical protein
MAIEQNEMEKLKGKLLRNGQIGATAFDLARPNSEFQNRQPPLFFG